MGVNAVVRRPHSPSISLLPNMQSGYQAVQDKARIEMSRGQVHRKEALCECFPQSPKIWPNFLMERGDPSSTLFALGCHSS